MMRDVDEDRNRVDHRPIVIDSLTTLTLSRYIGSDNCHRLNADPFHYSENCVLNKY